MAIYAKTAISVLKSATTIGVILTLSVPTFALGDFSDKNSTAPAPSVQRAQFLEDEGASQRIDFSGKLRMLSQRIPAAACNLASGIDTETSQTLLVNAAAEFEQIVDALEFGDDNLGIIGAETRRKTLVQIADLRERWEPMFTVAQTVDDNGGTVDQIAIMAAQSGEVLSSAKLLVSEISGQYSDPTALLQSDAITIDIAGRQRMLTQRMSKNICLIEAGITTDIANAELETTMKMFDASLNALRYGMETAGIETPPNSDVEAGLDIVISDWAALMPFVQQVLAGEELDDETRGSIFRDMNAMTGHMNTVVGLYSEASKLQL